MEDFGDMNGIYAEFFTEPYPARAAFQVGALPKDALVEIECVAYQKKVYCKRAKTKQSCHQTNQTKKEFIFSLFLSI